MSKRAAGIGPEASGILRLITSRLVGIVQRFSANNDTGSSEQQKFEVAIGGKDSVSLSWKSVAVALQQRVVRSNEPDRTHTDAEMRHASFVNILSNLLAQDLVEHLIGLALKSWLLQPLAKLPAFVAKTRAMEEIQLHFNHERQERKSMYHLVLCTFSDLDWTSFENIRHVAFDALKTHVANTEAMDVLLREIGASVVDSIESRLVQKSTELEGVQQAMTSAVKVLRGQNRALSERLGGENRQLRKHLELVGNDNRELQAAVQREAAAVASAEEELLAQNQMLDKLGHRVAHHNQQQQLVEELERQIDVLRTENGSAREECVSLTARYNAEKKTLEKELRREVESARTIVSQHADETMECQELSQTAAKLCADVEQMRRTLSAHEAAHAQTRAEVMSHEERAEQVQQRLYLESHAIVALHREYEDADANRRALLAVQHGLREEVDNLANQHETGVARAEALLREQQSLRRELEKEQVQAALALSTQKKSAEAGIAETTAQLQEEHFQLLERHAAEASHRLHLEEISRNQIEQDLQAARTEVRTAHDEIHVALQVNQELSASAQQHARSVVQLQAQMRAQRAEMLAETEAKLRAVLGNEVDSVRVQNAIVSSNIALLTDQHHIENASLRLSEDLRFSEHSYAAAEAKLRDFEVRAASEVQHLRMTELRCESELASLSQVVDEGTARSVDTESRLVDATNAASRLRDEYMAVVEEIREQGAQYAADVNVVQEAEYALRAALAAAQDQLAAEQAHNKQLSAAMDKARREAGQQLAETASALSTEQRTEQRLSSILRESTAKVDALQASKESLETKYAELSSEASKLQVHEQTASSRVAELSAQVKSLQEQSSEAAEALKRARETFSQELDQARASSLGVKDQLLAAAERQAATQESLVRWKALESNAKLQASDLRGEIQQERERNLRYGSEIEALTDQLSSSKSEHIAAVNKLRSDIQHAKTSWQDAVASQGASETLTSKLQEQAAALKDEVQDKEGKLVAMKEVLQRFEHNQQLREVNSRLRHQEATTQLRDEIQQAQSSSELTTQALRSKCTSLETSLASVEATLENAALKEASFHQEMASEVAASHNLQLRMEQLVSEAKLARLREAETTSSALRHVDTITALGTEVDSLRQEVQVLESVATTSKSELAEYAARLAELTQEEASTLSSLQAELVSSRQERDLSAEQHEASRSELADQLRVRETLEVRLRDYSACTDRHSQITRDFEEQLKAAHATTKDLQHRVDAEQQHASALFVAERIAQTELKSAEDSALALKSTLSSVEIDHQNQVTHSSELISSLRQSLQATTSELNEAKVQASKFASDEAHAREMYKEAHEDLSQSQSEIAQLRLRAQDLRSTETNVQQHKMSLESALERDEMVVNELRTRCDAAQNLAADRLVAEKLSAATIEHLEQQQSYLNDTMAQIKADAAHRTTQFSQEVDELRSQLQNAEKDLKASLEKRLGDSSRMTEKLHVVNQNAGKLAVDNATSQANNDRLKVELSTLQQQAATRDAEYRAVFAAESGVQGQLTASKIEVREYRSQLDRVTDALQSALVEQDELGTQLDEARAETKSLNLHLRRTEDETENAAIAHTKIQNKLEQELHNSAAVHESELQLKRRLAQEEARAMELTANDTSDDVSSAGDTEVVMQQLSSELMVANQALVESQSKAEANAQFLKDELTQQAESEASLTAIRSNMQDTFDQCVRSIRSFSNEFPPLQNSSDTWEDLSDRHKALCSAYIEHHRAQHLRHATELNQLSSTEGSAAQSAEELAELVRCMQATMDARETIFLDEISALQDHGANGNVEIAEAQSTALSQLQNVLNCYHHAHMARLEVDVAITQSQPELRDHRNNPPDSSTSVEIEATAQTTVAGLGQESSVEVSTYSENDVSSDEDMSTVASGEEGVKSRRGTLDFAFEQVAALELGAAVEDQVTEEDSDIVSPMNDGDHHRGEESTVVTELKNRLAIVERDCEDTLLQRDLARKQEAAALAERDQLALRLNEALAELADLKASIRSLEGELELSKAAQAAKDTGVENSEESGGNDVNDRFAQLENERDEFAERAESMESEMVNLERALEEYSDEVAGLQEKCDEHEVENLKLQLEVEELRRRETAATAKVVEMENQLEELESRHSTKSSEVEATPEDHVQQKHVAQQEEKDYTKNPDFQALVAYSRQIGQLLERVSDIWNIVESFSLEHLSPGRTYHFNFQERKEKMQRDLEILDKQIEVESASVTPSTSPARKPRPETNDGEIRDFGPAVVALNNDDNGHDADDDVVARVPLRLVKKKMALQLQLIERQIDTFCRLETGRQPTEISLIETNKKELDRFNDGFPRIALRIASAVQVLTTQLHSALIERSRIPLSLRRTLRRQLARYSAENLENVLSDAKLRIGGLIESNKEEVAGLIATLEEQNDALRRQLREAGLDPESHGNESHHMIHRDAERVQSYPRSPSLSRSTSPKGSDARSPQRYADAHVLYAEQPEVVPKSIYYLGRTTQEQFDKHLSKRTSSRSPQKYQRSPPPTGNGSWNPRKKIDQTALVARKAKLVHREKGRSPKGGEMSPYYAKLLRKQTTPPNPKEEQDVGNKGKMAQTIKEIEDIDAQIQAELHHESAAAHKSPSALRTPENFLKRKSPTGNLIG